MWKVLAVEAARLARKIAVPASLPELSSRKVLTMAWLSGRSLRSDLEERAHAARRSNALVKGWRLWRLQRRAVTSLKRVAAAQGALIFGEGSPGFSADPHPGNVMVLEDGRLGLIDYGCSCCYIRRKSRCWPICTITSITTIELVSSTRCEHGLLVQKDGRGLYLHVRDATV